ncbi:hypothetical protein HAX54_047146, partial [Datura stramonium]|nr:hypothetical protein [Datura stramonium]
MGLTEQTYRSLHRRQNCAMACAMRKQDGATRGVAHHGKVTAAADDESQKVGLSWISGVIPHYFEKIEILRTEGDFSLRAVGFSSQ